MAAVATAAVLLCLRAGTAAAAVACPAAVSGDAAVAHPLILAYGSGVAAGTYGENAAGSNYGGLAGLDIATNASTGSSISIQVQDAGGGWNNVYDGVVATGQLLSGANTNNYVTVVLPPGPVRMVVSGSTWFVRLAGIGTGYGSSQAVSALAASCGMTDADAQAVDADSQAGYSSLHGDIWTLAGVLAGLLAAHWVLRMVFP